MKPIVKEILITLLLFIVILLVFGVLLYDYIPLNQVIPKVSEYHASDEVKKELKEIAVEDTSNVILTYEITDSDLGVYETTKSYDKGKANPFSSYNGQTTTTGSGVTNNNANGSTTTNTTSDHEQTTTSTQVQDHTGNSNGGSQNINTFYEYAQTK